LIDVADFLFEGDWIFSAPAMGKAIATLLVLFMAATTASCGGGATAPTAVRSASQTSSADNATSPTASATSASSPPVTVKAADAGACALLLARVQRVTKALATASELIAHSLNKHQLSHRIAIEKVQLQRSARLLTGGPVPTPLQGADRQLVLGLNAFSADFARAERPASRGDFQAAVHSMGDTTVVQQILAATKTIESACRGA
jgi:hypothetical protein